MRNNSAPTGGDYSPEDEDGLTEIYKQLSHLQWRKHINENNIRKAISTSKHMQERDLLLQLSVDRSAERARWVQAIVQDELSRPVLLPEPYLKDWEERHQVAQQRSLRDSTVHLRSIDKVKKNVETRKIRFEEQSHPPHMGKTRGSGVESDCTSSVKKRNDIEERIQVLHHVVRKKKRSLRQAVKNTQMQAGFSASSFKTGRGQR